MTETIFTLIFSAMGGAVAMMWKHIAANYRTVIQQQDEMRKTLDVLLKREVIYASCAAPACPAREQIARLEEQHGAAFSRKNLSPSPQHKKS